MIPKNDTKIQYRNEENEEEGEGEEDDFLVAAAVRLLRLVPHVARSA